MAYIQHTHQGARSGGTGARPITAAARTVARLIANHEKGDGNQRKVTRADILQMLDRAGRATGLNDAELATLKALVLRTRPEDWERGRTPMAWPGNQLLADLAGKTVSAIKARIRKFRALGLVVMRDSANGKRRGERDVAGRIVEAYGFDLTPLRVRHAELVALAEAYDAETKVFNAGKRAIGSVRRTVSQVRAQAAELGLTGQHWVKIADDIETVAVAAASARAARDVVRFRAAIAGLQAVENQATELFDKYVSFDQNDPTGSKNTPHIHVQTEILESVYAVQDCSPPEDATNPVPEPLRPRQSATTIKITPIEIAAMFPATIGFIPNDRPDWDDVCRGAAQLRPILGIRADTWIEASTRLGREGAAIAVLITCERQSLGEIKKTAGAYFAGMINKARRGELDLAKTLWGFRTTGARKQ